MEESTASLSSFGGDSASTEVDSTGSFTPNTSVISGKGKPFRPYKFSTLCATVDNPDAQHRDQWNSSSVPIYQSATFKGVGGTYDYTRSGNPTRRFLEHHVAKISHARHAFAVSSGMGALDIIFRLLKPGDEIIAGNDLYGGSNRLITYLRTNAGIHTHHIPTTDAANFLPLLEQPNSKVRMVLLETPTNPLLQIADISAIAELVHQHIPECIVVVDNTMMSPYLQRPLEHGADIVYDSATKYLSGHHDLMAGLVVCDRDDIAKGLGHVINSIGNGLAPNDCFLLIRGIKTMAIRMDAQQQTAIDVAQYLHNLGFKVHFPGLASHPGKEIHDRHARGPGAVLSFVTDDKALSERIVGATRLWGISVSFGCVNSLISMPCLMSHASIDPKVRKERNLPEDLIRLCVGIEDTEDLIDDLEAALLEAGAICIAEDAQGNRIVERVMSPFPDADQNLVASSSKLTLDGDHSSTSLTVSAPGKVILFGEHAVVHGATAIAGALDLRCFCSVTPRFDNKLSLVLPDISYEATWSLDALPQSYSFDSAWQPENSPDPKLVQELERLLQGESEQVAEHAALGFLYLYTRLSKEKMRIAQTFVVRSTLPIGAGLGSSAAFSVCIASGLLYSHGHLQRPNNSGKQSIASNDADLVNRWAFVAEKVNHGTPSGVDNAVATHGGAIAYAKGSGMEVLHGFKSLRFLLTNTKIPRNTKTLVANVGKLKEREPERINAVMTRINQISLEAKNVLGEAKVSRQSQLETLQRLIEENSTHLNTLQVSHLALELVRQKTKSAPYNLSSKLTGAGGGGCAVTLIPDDFSDALLQQLRLELTSEGFDCFETKVGGGGLGVASGLNPDSATTSGKPISGQNFIDASVTRLPSIVEGLDWAFV